MPAPPGTPPGSRRPRPRSRSARPCSLSEEVAAFDYSNLNGRRRGPFLTAAGWVVPGVARVQDQAEPYARAWRQDNLAALGSDGPLWVALGDSLTQGIGASAHDRGWVGQLHTRLAERGRTYRLVNLGVSGARTADVEQHQLPVLESLPEPDLVTLMIGSNDLMRPRYRRELVSAMERVLRRLPARSVVTTLPNPSRVAQESNRMLTRVAGECGLVVAELRDPRTTHWRGKLAADHFHPNDAGYASLAEVVADAVAAR